MFIHLLKYEQSLWEYIFFTHWSFINAQKLTFWVYSMYKLTWQIDPQSLSVYFLTSNAQEPSSCHSFLAYLVVSLFNFHPSSKCTILSYCVFILYFSWLCFEHVFICLLSILTFLVKSLLILKWLNHFLSWIILFMSCSNSLSAWYFSFLNSIFQKVLLIHFDETHFIKFLIALRNCYLPHSCVFHFLL